MSSERLRGRLAQAAWLASFALAAACAQEPYPDRNGRDRRVSEEVYRVMCKRVAKTVYPADPDAIRFNDVCDGTGDASGALAPAEANRLKSLSERRSELVSALDQVFGDVPAPSSEGFADGEITRFLAQIVPYYDPPAEILPSASDAIADVLRRLIEPLDGEARALDPNSRDAQRAQAVLQKLELVARRKGYRASHRTLGALRPILSYPGLDEVSQELLGFVGEGGTGHDAMVALLRAGALELAEEPVPADPNDPDRIATTLHTVLDLLLSEDDLLAEQGQGPSWVLRRDAQGNALAKAGASGPMHTPFPVPGQPDTLQRGPLEPAAQLYELFDASKTALAGAMRETKAIVERPAPDQPSTLDNFMRGLRPLMGPTVARSVTFAGRPYAFQGPDLAQGAMLDLIHALGVFSTYQESIDLLTLVRTLLKDHESAAMGPVFAAINIKNRANMHEEAVLTGYDGTPATASEFWDDVIAIGQRMQKRAGMIESMIKSFADPKGAAQGKLYGTWMRFKDDVTYAGAPIVPNGPGPAKKGGAYTAQQKQAMNAPINLQYQLPVDRSQPDVGMNRSIWQRTMSLINALNGKKICNKKGGSLTVNAVIGDLTFPLANAAGYQDCELVEIQNAVEIYVQAVLKSARITLKDVAAVGLGSVSSPFGLVTGVPPGSGFGKIQEVYSDIDGFTDTPSAESMARFIYAPPNKFIANLFTPITSNDGAVMQVYEPNALFHMENKQAVADNQNLFTAGAALMKALDDKELRTPGELGPKLTDGYMYGHMLSVFHRHWSSHKAAPCALPAVPGDEGCTQSLDPKAPLYAQQSNLISYEPLLGEALVDEDLTGILQRAASEVQRVTINGKDGLAVIAAFVNKLLTPDPALTFRDGRKFAYTNTCAVAPGTVDAPAACGCPAGSSERDAETCALPNGAAFARGRILAGGIPPIYLVLDALKKIDQGFAAANQPRLTPWHTARSRLVDQFLTAEASPDRTQFRMANQRARAMGLKIMQWLLDRVAAHQRAGDLQPWALGLAGRFEKTFGHPLAAAGLDLLDQFWENQGAATQWANISAYIMDPQRNPEGFDGFLVALADTITLVDREPDVTPLVQFAALLAAPNAFQALDTGAPPDAERSAFYRGLEVARNVMSVDESPAPSALSKLLKNLVLPAQNGESPLETILDVVAEVNRRDPLLPSTVQLSAADDRQVFEQLRGFMTDPEHGLRRLYSVIQNRKVKN